MLLASGSREPHERRSTARFTRRRSSYSSRRPAGPTRRETCQRESSCTMAGLGPGAESHLLHALAHPEQLHGRFGGEGIEPRTVACPQRVSRIIVVRAALIRRSRRFGSHRAGGRGEADVGAARDEGVGGGPGARGRASHRVYRSGLRASGSCAEIDPGPDHAARARPPPGLGATHLHHTSANERRIARFQARVTCWQPVAHGESRPRASEEPGERWIPS